MAFVGGIARAAAQAAASAGARGIVNRYVFGQARMKRRRPRRARALQKGAWTPSRTSSRVIADQKIFDAVSSLSYNVTTTGSIVLLNGIAAGTDYNQRDGRRAIIDSVSIQGDLFYSSTTLAHPADLVRFMIVYDKQANGAQPLITDILNFANADSFYNINNLGRFEVLSDWTSTLPQVPAATTSAVYFPKIKLNKRISRGTEYSGTGGGIATISSGALYLIAIGSQVTGSNNTVLEMSARVMFRG